MQDGGGRHFLKSQNRHISAMVWPIATKFSTVTHIYPLDRADRQKFETLKIHEYGGRHSDKKTKNRQFSWSSSCNIFYFT